MMKLISIPMTLALTVFLVSCQTLPKADPSSLTGPYMGQTPPGKTAEVFAPNVISTDGWELEGVFAPGMNEFYYTAEEGADRQRLIFGYQYDGKEWHEFTKLPRTGETFISADGKTMHLTKGYRERTSEGWSDVKSLGPMFDRNDLGIMRLTASSLGTYVFDDFMSGGLIRISKRVNGQQETPVEMPQQINSGKRTAHPFIAPDESYIIWDSERDEGFGGSDLYISFRHTDGTWGAAINMGPNVNSDKNDFFGSITPDGKFLMFNRTISRTDDHTNVDIYWVDAQFIEELRK